METRQYYDVSGNECSLGWLVRNEPEWAANQIRHRDSLAAEVGRLEAENEKLRELGAALRDSAANLGYTSSLTSTVIAQAEKNVQAWDASTSLARLEGRSE